MAYVLMFTNFESYRSLQKLQNFASHMSYLQQVILFNITWARVN